MPFSNPEFDRYRLVLVSPSTRCVLVEKLKNEFRLPRISVPRWTRAAEEITAIIRERWQFGGVILDFLGERPGAGTVVVAQRIEEGRLATCPAGHLWSSLDDIVDAEIGGQERSILERLLANGETGRGPFSRLGWIDDVLGWISANIGIHRSQISGQITQFNASADSTLIRVGGVTSRTFWFKATGEPNAHEMRATSTLSSLFPGYLPRTIAFHEPWNAWLMEHAGIPLGEYETMPSEIVKQVVRRLAELQSASVRHIGTLLSSGCHDLRMAALRAGIPELTPYLEEAMSTQDSIIGPRISARRIREITRLIEAVSFKVEEIGVPAALMHCDISLDNILIGAGTCVFTDWAQAGIGNPFVSFEQLRAQLAQRMGSSSRPSDLTRIYQGVWQTTLCSCQFGCAFTLLPLIALASDLLRHRDWLTSEHHHIAQSRSYARIFARQMDRAARMIELNEEICA